MKQYVYAAVLLTSMVPAQVLLAEQTQSDQKTQEVQQVMPSVSAFDEQLLEMQENTKQMQSLLEQIYQEQDPQRRQKLLQQHWGMMHNAMNMMRGMWRIGRGDCCMGGGGMRHGMMGRGKMRGYYSTLTPEQQKQRQYIRDQHMGMQQLMLEHMMEHQYWLNQPDSADK